jgi:hypothetical protein
MGDVPIERETRVSMPTCLRPRSLTVAIRQFHLTKRRPPTGKWSVRESAKKQETRANVNEFVGTPRVALRRLGDALSNRSERRRLSIGAARQALRLEADLRPQVGFLHLQPFWLTAYVHRCTLVYRL